MKKVLIFLIFCIFFENISSHPVSTFEMELVSNVFVENEESTVRFRFLDELNNNAPVLFSNLMQYHGRYIHVQFASQDAELVWHVHPEDFYDITASASATVFWVNVTFPRSGSYYVGASFLFKNGTHYREGASSVTLYVNGSTPMDTPSFNYTAVNYFTSYPIGSDDKILDPINVLTNLESPAFGIKIVFQVIQDTTINTMNMTTMGMMTTGGTTQTGLSTNPPDNNQVVLNKCSPFYIQVFLDDNNTPATSLIPYLRAPVHFTMVSPDGSVYHAHGSYLPDGYMYGDVAGVVKAMSGQNMTNDMMMNDPMMNLTMNGMMMGIMPNGSANCRSDAGKIMEYMPSMDHSLYYGPAQFGPAIVGLFDWTGYGNWRVFAWMKIHINGEDRLIVPHFSVNTILPPDTSTNSMSGMDMSSMDMGSASLHSVCFFLLAALIFLIH